MIKSTYLSDSENFHHTTLVINKCKIHETQIEMISIRESSAA